MDKLEKVNPYKPNYKDAGTIYLGNEWVEALNVANYKFLSCIKSNDPKIRKTMFFLK